MTGKNPNSTEPVPPASWEALARYLAGEASAAEAESVCRWLAGDPERARLLTGLEQPIERLRHVPPADLDVEAALSRVHARMEEPRGEALRVLPSSTSATRRVLGTGWTAALRVAAAVVLVAGGALLVSRLLGGRGQAPVPVVAATSYHTGVGQRASVRLPDGTRVLLGPGSSLDLAMNFPAARTVTLKGEALFEVSHDAAHPFAVQSGPALIQDVGTRFDVRGDAGEGVRIVVTEGAVQVGPAQQPGAAKPKSQPVVLRAGQAAVVRPDGATLAESAKSEDALAWTRGELVFRGAPVSEVASALKRWYGVELRVTDPGLARKHLTTSFAGESRERVLQVIALALGGRIEMHGDTAVLGP